jgi:hypothetical protein
LAQPSIDALSDVALPHPRRRDNESHRILEEMLHPVKLRRVICVQEAQLVETISTSEESIDAREGQPAGLRVNYGWKHTSLVMSCEETSHHRFYPRTHCDTRLGD